MGDKDTAVMETYIASGSCCNVDDAICYLEGSEDGSEIHCRTINLLKYIRDRERGVKPKYYKASKKLFSYWKCGHCGGRKVDVSDKFCPGCGYRIAWDNPACLTGVHEGETEE